MLINILDRIQNRRIRSRKNNQYDYVSSADREQILKIVDAIPNFSTLKLIDIGSGSGGLLKLVEDLTDQPPTGLEIGTIPHLLSCFIKHALGLRYRSIRADATQYAHYREHDIYYFFNPCPEQILSDIKLQIINSLEIGDTKWFCFINCDKLQIDKRFTIIEEKEWIGVYKKEVVVQCIQKK